jgi:hypothetical protein
MVLIVSIGVAGRAGLPVRLASAESDTGDISAGILSSNCLFALEQIMRLFRQLINAYLHLRVCQGKVGTGFPEQTNDNKEAKSL